MNSESREIEEVLGYRIFSGDAGSCAAAVLGALNKRNVKVWAACINPHSYIVAKSDPDFKRALVGADWLLPDGIGIVLASKVLGRKIRRRFTGSDLFHDVNSLANSLGHVRVFFLGGTTQALQSISQQIRQDYPRIELVGTYSPPFRDVFTDEDTEKILVEINRAKPDILWVGLSAPKQEKWISNNISKLNVKFIGAIGAVFDFYSGQVQRSSPVFQHFGLEWLPRLLQEPRRLWRRTIISAPLFVWYVILAWFRN